jgi:hypothetical protein
VKGFLAFWYDFVIGDDWRIAVGVVAGIGLTALIAHHSSVAIWWLLPTLVGAGLTASIWLASRTR